MAMSVVEAMQMGLVPVVTAVGEIASYCRQGDNSVVVESDQQAIETILSLLNCDEKFQAMRSKAIATWNGKPRYSESVLRACEMLLAANQKGF
jgi:glycosyltransferase involved in cell wall biosynthesis